MPTTGTTTLNPGSGGSVMDDVVVSSNHRQVIVLGDPTTQANYADVSHNGIRTVSGIVKDTNNSTTATLANAAVFTGASTDVSDFQEITFVMIAAPDVSSGASLSYQFSVDNANWDVAVPIPIYNGQIVIPQPLRVVAQFFRIVYTNGATTQTTFRLTTYLHRQSTGQLIRNLHQVIQPNQPMPAVRAMIEAGTKIRLSSLSADRSLGGEAIDARYVLADVAQFNTPFANNNVTTVATGGATITQAVGTGATLTTANASGASSSQIQGNKKIRYSPFRETRGEFSVAYMQAGIANSRAVVGLTDTPSAPLGASSNSLVVGYNGTTFGGFTNAGGTVTTQFSMTITSNKVTAGTQNGDPLDGSANSEFRSGDAPAPLDITQIHQWRMRFVYEGPVYWEVKSPDDKWVTVHIFTYPDTSQVPWIQNPDVFLCWDCTKTASAGTGTVQMRTFSAAAGTMEPEIDFEPHEVHGHTQVTVVMSGTSILNTATSTPYTVSTGRQLLVKSIGFTVNNTGTGQRLEVRDGGGSGTLKHAMQCGAQANGATVKTISLPVPLLFTTDVTLVGVGTGTLTVSGSVVGYEKEA